ncbi:MAG: MFS transporter [Thermoleophilaceae bacterium]
MTGRIRVIVCFAAFGAFWGAWGASVPAIQQRAGVSDAQLGLALLLVGIGALASMRFAGALFDRHGSAVTVGAVALFGVFGVLPGLAHSPVELCLSLALLGLASGAMDVAINAEAVQQEEHLRRPLLHSAHAAFSAAVVGSSLLTGALRAAGARPAIVLGGVGAAQLVLAVALRGSKTRLPAGGGAGRARRRLRPAAGLLILGGLCALAYWVENAWQSWGAIHLERTLHSSAAVSALGPAAFASAAVCGRLAAAQLARRSSDRVLITGGAVVGAAGTGLAAGAASVPVALLGIVVAGAGISVCAPTIISLAGGASPADERGAAVSTVTTIAYLGFILGPAAVGGVAGLADLRISLAVVAGLAALLALIGAFGPLPPRIRGGPAHAAGVSSQLGSRGESSSSRSQRAMWSRGKRSPSVGPREVR